MKKIISIILGIVVDKLLDKIIADRIDKEEKEKR
jgi:hypothetical protein